MMTSQTIHSDLAIPPGEFMLETMESLGMSQAELARRMDRPPQAINEMIKGEKIITPDTAIQLEQVLSVPAHIWTGLEAEYQLVQARHQDTERATQEVECVRRFPYRHLAQSGWVEKTRDRIKQVQMLRRFFGVASLHNLEVLNVYGAAFRRASKANASPESLAAWLRAGELTARRIEMRPYNEQQLKTEVATLPRFSTHAPDDFFPQLRERLAQCGVSLVLHPHFPHTYVHGAVFWPTTDRAVVLMSLRGRWADMFWFSLLHEIGHVLLHDRRAVFVENNSDDLKQKCLEQEADNFASNALITPTAYAKFVARRVWSQAAIKTFAKELGIAPGLVVGRLQHDGHIPHSRFNTLRTQYRFSSRTVAF